MAAVPNALPLSVSVAGGELALVRFTTGPPAGDRDPRPPVIAVHGITANSRAWWPVAVALGSRVELVAVDLRGRGDSRTLPGPYGLAVHEGDLLAVLDMLELERAVLVGHSLGAFLVAHVAARNPDRVAGALLIDGGLPLTRPQDPDQDPHQDDDPDPDQDPDPDSAADPAPDLDAQLAPVLARFALSFASHEDCLAWWRLHPALRGGQVDDDVLARYADHDLTGTVPELRPSVSEPAIRADALEVGSAGAAAAALTVTARMLVAARGMLDGPDPLQPLALAQAWAAAAPGSRTARLVPDTNHYTIVMGRAGAAVVAQEIDDLSASG